MKPPDDSVFREPWEAQVFALATALRDRGLFSAEEWAQALGAEIAAAGAGDDGQSYYRHLLKALERMIVAKKITSDRLIDLLQHAWAEAAEATPHGKPIELDPAARNLARDA